MENQAIKIILQQTALNVLVALTISSPGLAAAVANSSQESHLLGQILAYDPPSRGAPSNRNDAGSREPHHFFAVIPAVNLGLTAIGHPTFWLYLPAPIPNNTYFDFVLHNAHKEVVFQTSFELEKTSGFASFCLPQNSPPLEIGQKYHWSFFWGNISCNGWVERVAVEAEILFQLETAGLRQRVLLLAKCGLWYETITELIALRDKLLSQLQAATLEERLQIYAENDLQYEAIADLTGFEKISSLPTLDADWNALLQHPFVRLDDVILPPFV